MRNIIKEIEKKIQADPIMKELQHQHELTKSHQSLSRFRSSFETEPKQKLQTA